jgi:hypothetical protein
MRKAAPRIENIITDVAPFEVKMTIEISFLKEDWMRIRAGIQKKGAPKIFPDYQVRDVLIAISALQEAIGEEADHAKDVSEL